VGDAAHENERHRLEEDIQVVGLERRLIEIDGAANDSPAESAWRAADDVVAASGEDVELAARGENGR